MGESKGLDAAAGQFGRVCGAALVGTFVEWFDFGLFAYTLPIFALEYFGLKDPNQSLLYTFVLVFAVPFVIRPLGGAFWGHLGDRVGRRATLALMILAMGIATALVAVVPTMAAIGIAAPTLIVVLRVVQSFCASAEAAGATTFVFEQMTSKRRGLLLNLLNSFSVVPAACAAMVVFGMTELIGPDQFKVWGWRVLFVLGGVIAMVGLYIRRRLPETHPFTKVAEAGSRPEQPVLEVIREYPLQILCLLASIGAPGLAYYVLVGFFSTHLSQGLGLSPEAALLSNSASVFAVGVLSVVFGYVSDKLKRRKPLLLAGLAILAAGGIPAFYVVNELGWAGALGGQLLIALGIAVVWGGGVPFVMESFPTRVRFSGAAISITLSYAIFGGTAPMVSQYLLNTTGVAVAPGYYLAAMSALALVTLAAFGKESAGSHRIEANDRVPEAVR